MKFKTKFDIIIIVLFIIISTYYAKKYLFTKSVKKTEIQLKEAPEYTASKRISELITETSPNDSYDSWYPERLSNRWKHINIFQSGLLSGNIETLSKRIFKKMNVKNCGFHFVITNGYGGEDGLVYTTKCWQVQGDTLPILDSKDLKLNSQEEANLHDTITICLIGDFSAQPPTQKQIASLKALLNYLTDATTLKTFNITFNSTKTLEKLRNPEYFPLNLLIKTRTAN